MSEQVQLPDSTASSICNRIAGQEQRRPGGVARIFLKEEICSYLNISLWLRNQWSYCLEGARAAVLWESEMARTFLKNLCEFARVESVGLL